MAHSIGLLGLNTSGRTNWLSERRKERRWPSALLIGPYPDNACTGLAWRAGEEFALASCGETRPAENPTSLLDMFDLSYLLERPLHVLSGGEIVRLAFASALARRPAELQVDVAFEQLDAEWRSRLFSWLEKPNFYPELTAAIADNRFSEREIASLEKCVQFPQNPGAPEISPGELRSYVDPASPCAVRLENISFSYTSAPSDVLTDVSLNLEPGQIYFLNGPNGSGKTTFTKLLCGTVVPRTGRIKFGDVVFSPRKTSKRYVAIAFQHPDYQWTSLTVRSQLASFHVQRIAKGRRYNEDECLRALGVPVSFLDQNPIELPFLFKKRLSLGACWLSDKPWLVLDEPTIGQDANTRAKVAEYLSLALRAGVGLIAISHDTAFRDMFPKAKNLHLRDKRILQ